MTDVARCELCGEPMPAGEQMFKYHGYSGPCPKPPLPADAPAQISDDFIVNTWRNLHGAPYVPEMYQTVVAFGRSVLAAGRK